MSVAGYIGKNVERPGMIPRERESPEQTLTEDSAGVAKRDEEFYGSVEDYDPVLRGHCRL